MSKVDAEEEFWVQYEPNKLPFQLLRRSSYQQAHQEFAEASEIDYEKAIDTLIALQVEEETPEGDPKVSITDIKVIHLAKESSNWTTLVDGTEVLMYPLWDTIDDSEKIKYTLATIPTVPSWVRPYQEMFDELAAIAEEDYAAIHAENQRLVGEAYQQAHDAETLRLEEKAEDSGMTVEEVISEESVEGRSTEPDQPEFAVFLNGYGQRSPLYSIYNECQQLGHGVYYDAKKGLCNFTQSYCDRYGVDFFYNNELGVYDCQASLGMIAAEYIFGTTITRSTRRGWRDINNGSNNVTDPNAPVGSSKPNKRNNKLGTCRKALGSVKMPGGVAVKAVQNGDNLNHVGTITALDTISKLGLSGF